MDQWDFLQKEEHSLKGALEHAPLDDRSFSEWSNELVVATGVSKSAAIRKAKINPTFAYQIFAGQRLAKRDKLIQLAFGLELDIPTASEFLERAGANALSPRSSRDVTIAFCLLHNMSVPECDETLCHAGHAPLRKDYPHAREWW